MSTMIPMYKTKVIYVDGMKGAGKSTLIGLLAEKLREKGMSCQIFIEKQYEPLKTELAKWKESPSYLSPQAEDLMALANASAEVHRRYVYPLLDNVDYLIFDRSVLSGAVYMEDIGVNGSTFVQLNYDLGVVQPDIILLLVCSVEIATKRIAKRARPGFKPRSNYSSEVDYLVKTRQGYLEIHRIYKARLIDTNGPVEKVLSSVLQVLGV